MNDKIIKVSNELDSFRKVKISGVEYWLGRDLQQILNYSRWEDFYIVIQKAQITCESVGENPANHFREYPKKVLAGSGAMVPQQDYYLSRYACYLIAMNGNPKKPEIATAQDYFAVQTRKQEIQEQLTEDERRLQLRNRVKDSIKKLNTAAKEAGVQKYAVFHDAGYKGLYEMGVTDIKKQKGIPQKEQLLDCIGPTELAANYFKATQAEEKLIRDRVNNERQAIQTHEDVGREVRNTIKKLGGTMPEDLPSAPSIKKLEKDLKKKRKELPGGTSSS